MGTSTKVNALIDNDMIDLWWLIIGQDTFDQLLICWWCWWYLTSCTAVRSSSHPSLTVDIGVIGKPLEYPLQVSKAVLHDIHKHKYSASLVCLLLTSDWLLTLSWLLSLSWIMKSFLNCCFFLKMLILQRWRQYQCWWSQNNCLYLWSSWNNQKIVCRIDSMYICEIHICLNIKD